MQTTEWNNNVSKASEAVLLFGIGLYIFVKDNARTMLDLGIPRNIDSFIFAIVLAASVARLGNMVIENNDKRKELFRYIGAAMLIDIVYIAIYQQNHSSNLIFLSLFTIATIGMDYVKVLKVYSVAAAMILLPTIAMAWIGAVDNLVYIRDMTIRSSWGIRYPTDLISILLFLLLALWAAFKEKNGLWFLIPGSALALMALYVADSRTGLMCTLMFEVVVLADHYIKPINNLKLKKAIRVSMCMTFPILAVFMNGMVLAYRHGFWVAHKFNQLMSDRLALSSNAFNKYGLSLMGQSTNFIGWGGTTYQKPIYDFVDISYVLILLRFGLIALVLISVLWMIMTHKALSTGNRRLAAVLTLIAINAAAEHHIMNINYDIYLAMPFAIIAIKDIQKTNVRKDVIIAGEHSHSLKEAAIKLSVVAALVAVVSSIVLQLLPKARTLITLINIDDRTEGRRLMTLVIVVGLFLTAIAMESAYKIILGLINKECHIGKKQIFFMASFVVAVCIAVTGSNYVISNNASKKDATLERERDVIELIQENNSGKLYVKGMPDLYQKKFGGISNSLFDGEELARYRNTSVIIRKYLDSSCFFNSGFLYLPISEKHALYTNDESVIRTLQKKGYHLTGYYPIETDIKMYKMASSNGLKIEDDGSILLHGENESLHKGPRSNLRAGRYTITYNLAIDPLESGNLDDEICRLVVTYYKGKYVMSNLPVTRKKFNEYGKCIIKVIVDMPDAENTDFCVYPIGQNSIKVKGISYKKTPKCDTHMIFNEDRVVVREEYYDLDGAPYDVVAGFFAKDLGYDNYGNVNHEIYYDKNNSRTLCSAGYGEIKKKFNGLHNIMREEYYGTDSKRCALPSGQSAEEMKYDEKGNQIEVRFYGVKDEPVLAGGATWGGYHGMIREFGENGLITKELFFGTEGEPVMIKEGYASRTYKYDENGYRIEENYYDVEDNPTLCAKGYSAVKKKYDVLGRVVKEEYYGIDGERISLMPGQAAVEYVYDEEGHQKELLYLDINDNPIEVGGNNWGGYQRVVREFNEKGYVVKETFLDTEGNPTVIKEGYSSREYEYDDEGNRVKQICYNINGNKVNSEIL